jgi:periplasmic copper chaperone A
MSARTRLPLRFLLCLAVQLAGAAALASAADAHSYKLGTVKIGHIWGPPSGASGASVYGPLFQSGPKSDYLTAASSPLGDSVIVQDSHGATQDWGDGLELRPGEPVSLAGFGVHLQVIGLKHPVKEGDSFPLKLTFKNAGTITVKVLVQTSPSD